MTFPSVDYTHEQQTLLWHLSECCKINKFHKFRKFLHFGVNHSSVSFLYRVCWSYALHSCVIISVFVRFVHKCKLNYSSPEGFPFCRCKVQAVSHVSHGARQLPLFNDDDTRHELTDVSTQFRVKRLFKHLFSTRPRHPVFEPGPVLLSSNSCHLMQRPQFYPNPDLVLFRMFTFY